MLSFDERVKAWNALNRKERGLLRRDEWMMADEDKMAGMVTFAEIASPDAARSTALGGYSLPR